MTCWDVDQHRSRSRISAGTVVVDIGASTGEFALPASEAGGDVLCVEVLLENCVILRNLGLTVLEAAAGPSDGTCDLTVGTGDSFHTGSHIELIPGGTRMVSLASIVDEAGGIVDVMKVDIEGGEYALFETADESTMRRIEFLAIEFHRWTAPNELRLDGVGVRIGTRYIEGSMERLVEKLSRTHTVEVSGTHISGGTMWAELKKVLDF